ncbi:MAG: hypothetical protein J0I20_26215 [Chloroflexi bacterium]|nr:hypothetical protein [Chloroflexota bacterium]OJW06454.1 MAG: hypothetical protein BGO39_00080 [Chloroflexi bacterium 54-19]
MATTFSHTLRSLRADNFRGSIWLVLLGVLALIFWFGWFFFAQILIYSTSQSASLQSSNRAVAVFPLSEVKRLHPGQTARLQLAGLENNGTITGRVSNIEQTAQGLQVSLDLQPAPDVPVQLQNGMSGSVKIEVEQVSPATLVLRAIGAAPGGQVVFLAP